MKPTLEQVQEWRAMAYRYADKKTGDYNEADEIAQEKFAELAAQWGAEQAQQTTEEPELPEAVAHCALSISGKRISYFDGKPVSMPGPVGNDSHPDPLFTATQMHDHYAAGVRAGMAQQSQDAKRYRWLRDSGFAYANVDLGTDLDGDNFVRYQIRFDIPEPAHSKFEDDEWSASDIDAAIDAAMQGGQK